MADKSSRKIPPLMIALWVGITVVGVLGALLVVPWLMPETASNTMHLSVLTMVVFSVASAPVAVESDSAFLHLVQHPHEVDLALGEWVQV